MEKLKQVEIAWKEREEIELERETMCKTERIRKIKKIERTRNGRNK